MRLVMFALLSTISASALADMHEDQAERACESAARAFYTVAEAAHGHVSAVDTPDARDAYLSGFAHEWNRYLTNDTAPAPTASLRPWLLDAWAHGVSMLHTMGDVKAMYEVIGKQWVLDGEDELNRHCMYALGKLDGEGRLLKVLGMVPASSVSSSASQTPRSGHH